MKRLAKEAVGRVMIFQIHFANPALGSINAKDQAVIGRDMQAPETLGVSAQIMDFP